MEVLHGVDTCSSRPQASAESVQVPLNLLSNVPSNVSSDVPSNVPSDVPSDVPSNVLWQLCLELPQAAVVWKPAGMRACGPSNFTHARTCLSAVHAHARTRVRAWMHTRTGVFAGTLQWALRRLLPSCGAAWPIPISRLEIGCAGLCVVSRTPSAEAELLALAARAELGHTCAWPSCLHTRLRTCLR